MRVCARFRRRSGTPFGAWKPGRSATTVGSRSPLRDGLLGERDAAQQDRAAMTTVLVAFGTTLATLCIVGFGLWLSRRGALSREERMSLVIGNLNARMETMRGELEQALDTAQDEVR